MPIQTILLAAGVGSRFGGDKLTARLPEGTPVALASARALLAAGCDVLAVVRHADTGAGSLLAGLPGVQLLPCPESAAGLGRSLACGVRHSIGASGWLVALADMPSIRPATIARALSLLRQGAPLVAPAYAGQRGHPVGFGVGWRERLLALTGDRGARALLAAQPGGAWLFETDDPGVLRDIDRYEDLAARAC